MEDDDDQDLFNAIDTEDWIEVNEILQSNDVNPNHMYKDTKKLY